jgi:hypothetical protein
MRNVASDDIEVLMEVQLVADADKTTLKLYLTKVLKCRNWC